MYAWNGKRLSPAQIARRGRWNRRGKVLLARLKELPHPVKLAFGMTLIVLLVMCAGCATNSTLPDSSPRNPEPPPSRLPASPPSYLTDAQRDISQWRKLLNELTSKPAN